jgi:hypothetical protein
MSEVNQIDVNTDNLDDFNLLLNGQAEQAVEIEEEAEAEQPEQEIEEEVEENSEAEDLATEDEQGNEEEEEELPPVKPKSKFQTRIDELTEKARLEKEARLELQARLDALLSGKEEKKEAPAQAAVKSDAPDPDALNDKGDLKYPLGEFDPLYIRDLTRFTLRQESEQLRAAEAEAAALAAKQAETQALAEEWDVKLEEVKTRLPDFQEKAENLVTTFGNLEPGYGEYLGNTIMSMDKGADVLYYLANNLDVARQIAKSGPAKATLALGKLEAMFDEPREEPKPKPKTSKTPAPPPTTTRGSAPSLSVPADTDDLAAFEAQFFKRG